MNTQLNDDLSKAYEAFSQDHDALRQALVASLPDRSGMNREFSRTACAWQSTGGTIMHSRIAKIAVAAVIIAAALVGVVYWTGSIDGSNVAWAEVTGRIAHVDYVHCYYFKSRADNFARHFEAWYAHGNTVVRGNKGDMAYDDGRTLQGFDEHSMLTVREPSRFAQGRAFFESFSGGLLSDKNEQLSQQIPTHVGDDFLIYRFAPSPAESDFIEGIFVTVGRNSLLPVQVKIYHKDSDYDLIMFDYEAPEKPAEFFEPPPAGPPNGKGEVLLDGEEVMIPIADAPGIKTAIVRLGGESAVDGEKPTFCLDMTFITEEGFRSQTSDLTRWKVDEAKQCGVGAGNWPDGRYRNIRFSPWLRPTGKEGSYVVEIRCRLRTEED